MFASTTIANEIIARDPQRNALGICKLVYLAHGWSLAFDIPLVADMPHYYPYGPIHPPVYDMLRANLDNPVGTPHPVPGATSVHRAPRSEEKIHGLLDQIVEKHSHMTSVQLSSYCHAPNTPFEMATRQKNWKKTLLNTPMSETSIKAYFGRVLDSASRQAAA